MNEVTIYNETDEEFTYQDIIEKVVNKAFEVGRQGNIFNNITVMQGANSISSDEASFDVNNNYIFFKDNVTVYYVPEEK